MVSTRDSDRPTSCEMKEEPEFKPLQGNRASSLSEGEVSWFSRVEAGNVVHSRVMAGVAIKNFCFFRDVRTPL